MRLATLLTLTASAALLSPLPASATGNDASVPLMISASVDAFCRVSIDSAEVQADGGIGRVVEVCNVPSGYVVAARFVNLAGGVVAAGPDRVQVGEDGEVRLSSDSARRMARQWALEDGLARDPARPIQVRFSIQPL